MEGDSKSMVSMFPTPRQTVNHQPRDLSNWSVPALIWARQPHLACSQGHTLLCTYAEQATILSAETFGRAGCCQILSVPALSVLLKPHMWTVCKVSCSGQDFFHLILWWFVWYFPVQSDFILPFPFPMFHFQFLLCLWCPVVSYNPTFPILSFELPLPVPHPLLSYPFKGSSFSCPIWFYHILPFPCPICYIFYVQSCPTSLHCPVLPVDLLHLVFNSFLCFLAWPCHGPSCLAILCHLFCLFFYLSCNILSCPYLSSLFFACPVKSSLIWSCLWYKNLKRQDRTSHLPLDSYGQTHILSWAALNA